MFRWLFSPVFQNLVTVLRNLFFLIGIPFAAYVTCLASRTRISPSFVKFLANVLSEPHAAWAYEKRYWIVTIVFGLTILALVASNYRRRNELKKMAGELADQFFGEYCKLKMEPADHLVSVAQGNETEFYALAEKTSRFLDYTCNMVSKIFHVYTGCPCHVSVKTFNPQSDQIATRARDPMSLTDRARVDEALTSFLYRKNTAFANILDDAKCGFFLFQTDFIFDVFLASM